jgi:hypothetical protein
MIHDQLVDELMQLFVEKYDEVARCCVMAAVPGYKMDYHNTSADHRHGRTAYYAGKGEAFLQAKEMVRKFLTEEV